MTLAESVTQATRVLVSAGLPAEDSRHDAALLARWRLGWGQTEWLAHLRESEPVGFAAQFHTLIRRRANREPVAYITGTREFYGRHIKVTPDVLIPRPETELLVEEALAVLAGMSRAKADAPRVADVGTGSGCLAITIALEWPAARVLAIDVSQAALTIAHENAVALGAAARIEFWRGAFLPAAVPPFDLIVSNPPYVAEREWASLPIEVRAFEPGQALFGGPDGLRIIRALVPAAADALAPGGWFVMEIGAGQAGEVTRVIEETGSLTVHRIRPDLQSIPRVVVARRR